MDDFEAFKTEHPKIWTWLLNNEGKRGTPREFTFASSLYDSLYKWGHLTDRQLTAATKCMVRYAEVVEGHEVAKRTVYAPFISAAGIDRLKAAFDKAIAFSAAKGRTLHSPRITFGNIVIKPAKDGSANPGALYVTDRGTYIGKIVNSKFVGTASCTEEQKDRMLAFVADPKAAAEAYGQETGTCCICNAKLTNKVSIERGIGPICAEKFGW